MRGSGRLAAVRAGALCAAAALGTAGCGGGERQDADEPAGTWRLEVVDASFPARQSVSDPSRLVLAVRNASQEPAPDVAVTIATSLRGGGGGAGGAGSSGDEMSGAEQAFSMDIDDPSAADRSRPIWVVDDGPAGGDTAYTNTWALGRLEAGETRRFVWRLTAVRPGSYRVSYAVSPGLAGRARVRDGTGRGAFKVAISDAPPQSGVDAAGNVIREPAQ